MSERNGIITFKGNPMTLVGQEVKVGDKAPDFTVVDNGLATTSLATYGGKVKIFSAVPSLDTPVCDTETRRFNQEAANLPGNVVLLTRAIFVVDADDIVRYVQIVPEVTSEPDYAAVIAAAKALQ